MKAIAITQNGSKKRAASPVLATRLLDDVGRCLTPAVARRLIAIRADAETQARVEELAGKCNEGLLTAKERKEYDSYVSTSTFIAILQANARAFLARHEKGR